MASIDENTVRHWIVEICAKLGVSKRVGPGVVDFEMISVRENFGHKQLKMIFSEFKVSSSFCRDGYSDISIVPVNASTYRVCGKYNGKSVEYDIKTMDQLETVLKTVLAIFDFRVINSSNIEKCIIEICKRNNLPDHIKFFEWKGNRIKINRQIINTNYYQVQIVYSIDNDTYSVHANGYTGYLTFDSPARNIDVLEDALKEVLNMFPPLPTSETPLTSEYHIWTAIDRLAAIMEKRTI